MPLPLELDVSGQICGVVIDLVVIVRLDIAFKVGGVGRVGVVVVEFVVDDDVVLLFGTD